MEPKSRLSAYRCGYYNTMKDLREDTYTSVHTSILVHRDKMIDMEWDEDLFSQGVVDAVHQYKMLQS